MDNYKGYKTIIKLKCKECGKEFGTPLHRIKCGRGKFCSKKCGWENKRKLVGKKNHGWKEKIKCICQTCKRKFEIQGSLIKRGKGNGKYCSKKCMGEALKILYKGENSPRWKERVKSICQLCGKEFMILESRKKIGLGKYCSRSCGGIWRMKHSRKRNTSIEIKTENLLKKLKISYQAQKIIKEGKTIADFYIPAQRIVIYCDGDYWHSLEPTQKRDATQDLLLGLNGFKVLRFKGSEILNNSGKIKRIIKKELK